MIVFGEPFNGPPDGGRSAFGVPSELEDIRRSSGTVSMIFGGGVSVRWLFILDAILSVAELDPRLTGGLLVAVLPLMLRSTEEPVPEEGVAGA